MTMNAMRIAALAALAASCLTTGCATSADSAAQPQEKVDKEYATGSRLPVRKLAPAPAAPAVPADKT
ncbi:MAG TPA: hypothetical protein VGC21_25660 [Telluria sp.]|jgi:predicted component of type VI protein secretion system